MNAVKSSTRLGTIGRSEVKKSRSRSLLGTSASNKSTYICLYLFMFSFNYYVISVLLLWLCLPYVFCNHTQHSSVVLTKLFQFPVMETGQLGGAVLLTANGRSDSLVHQSQRGIVIGDISHQYKILFSGGLEPFGIPG